MISSNNIISEKVKTICWGMVLISIHINLFHLSYIFTAIGYMLIFIGFRDLCNENKYFKICFYISALSSIYYIFDIIFIASPLSKNEVLLSIVNFMIFIFNIILIIMFSEAISYACKKVNYRLDKNPFMGLIILQIMYLLISFTSFNNSWIVFIIMVYLYIKFIKSIYRIGLCLYKSEYNFIAPKHKISNTIISYGYLLFSFIIVCLFCAFFNHLYIEDRPLEEYIMSENRNKLINLGFPDNIIEELPEENIEMMHNALQVSVSSEYLAFNKNYKIYMIEDIVENKIDKGNIIKVTTVYTELPNKKLYVLHYFEWINGNAFWEDGIRIWADFDRELKLVNAKLMFDKNNIRYIADFPRICSKKMSCNSFFNYKSDFFQIYGALSFPFNTKNQRGYVLYYFDRDDNDGIISTCSSFEYVHLIHPINIPYIDTEHRILNGGINDNLEIQQYTNYDYITR
ncbi:hypothetical protein JYG23_04090 [Sedimentibacter sp. zth1]|uniref:hypothetical protein n=1 Tax=Sedimentibacter sp. zth1 TaxID=2816908 RepID=UPI001A925DE1|nr:hypothetical protein [Sedimentibacter sp. zth1]QSX06644.1 hypothetical protein JYG23_04090 [Sedimentibacter sp. zth1]